MATLGGSIGWAGGLKLLRRPVTLWRWLMQPIPLNEMLGLQKKQMQAYPYLTVLRFVFVAVVTWHHLSAATSPYLGRSVVLGFFVLSAFLNPRGLIHKADTILMPQMVAVRYSLVGSVVAFTQYWWQFFWVRTVRIVPAYWVVVALCMLVFGVPKYAWTYWFYLQLIPFRLASPCPSWAGVHWSLCVEELFYFFCPLVIGVIAIIDHWRGNQVKNFKSLLPLFCLGGIGVSFLWRLNVVGMLMPGFFPALNSTNTRGGMFYLPPFSELDAFCVGILLAHMNASGALKELSQTVLYRYVRIGIFLFMGIFLVSYIGNPLRVVPFLNGLEYSTPSSDILSWLFWGVVIMLAVMANPNPRFPRVLARVLQYPWRIAHYVGMLSYGFYLYHYCWFAFVDQFEGVRELDGSLVLVLKLGGALILTLLSWNLVEQPMTRRFRNAQSWWPGHLLALAFKFRPLWLEMGKKGERMSVDRILALAALGITMLMGVTLWVSPVAEYRYVSLGNAVGQESLYNKFMITVTKGYFEFHYSWDKNRPVGGSDALTGRFETTPIPMTGQWIGSQRRFTGMSVQQDKVGGILVSRADFKEVTVSGSVHLLIPILILLFHPVMWCVRSLSVQFRSRFRRQSQVA